MMKLKPLSFKLDARSRFLSLAMLMVFICVVYYRGAYAPQASRLRDVKGRYLALRGEQKRMESSMPDLKAEQEKLQALKKEYESLSADVAKAEKALPKNVNMPDILKFLVKEKDKYNLKIVNIVARKDKAQDIPLYTPPAETKQKPVSFYSVLPIDIDMFGSFDDIIAYIGNIENRLPYQRVGALQIDMQKTTGGQPECFLTILSVLGRGEEADETLENFNLAMAEAEKLTSDNMDPFHKKEKPRTEERLAGAELNGIIHKKGIPYAIINGSSYKIGDLVQNKKIIKIDKDTVILEEENKLFKLSIKGGE